MGRIFTTTFLNNGEPYTAVISQIDGSMSIFLPDESLHTILPQGRISIDAQKGLKIDTPHLSPAQKLVLSILSTLEIHNSPALKVEKE
ncbi:MAG TPA: hypothetical protein VM884_05170 [Flavisolibacter sp.]|jgi:hypothetical protein|nr:hypothetical protein [Flavisolibacter sp.]